MTDSFRKRKWAGESVADKRRQAAPEPPRVPPHKKPKRYRLVVEWITTTHHQRVSEFSTKAAADEGRVKFARWLNEQKKYAKRGPYRYRASFWDGGNPLADYDSTTVSKVEAGPEFTVEQIVDTAAPEGE